jgi:hypothetical protein
MEKNRLLTLLFSDATCTATLCIVSDDFLGLVVSSGAGTVMTTLAVGTGGGLCRAV